MENVEAPIVHGCGGFEVPCVNHTGAYESTATNRQLGFGHGPFLISMSDENITEAIIAAEDAAHNYHSGPHNC